MAFTFTNWFASAGGGGGGGYTNTINIDCIGITYIEITVGNSGGNSCIGDSFANAGSNGGAPLGGNGGSGGGLGEKLWIWANYRYEWHQGSGGKDGSDGYGTTNESVGQKLAVGQGLTTRAFKESDGTLYSNGGMGGYGDSTKDSSNQPQNTGNGGNGGCTSIANAFLGYEEPGGSGGLGGSGIVIIRWGY